jgi:AcrR family transcriptional regulator
MDNKNRIIVESKALFLKLGIRSVSMDDIANQLGMSKKTIYQLFADKDELVDNIIDTDIQQIQADCTNCYETAKDAIDEIFKTMEMIVAQFRNMNPMVIFDLQKYHHKSFEKFMNHRNTFLLEIITNNLEKGVKEGFYRENIKIDILSRFRLESMMLAFNMDLYPPSKFNALEVTLEIIQHFLYGLSTESGYQLINEYKSRKLTNGQ